jgi:TolB-like protein/DNA-binding winged helix-turn-helix (wHTH) protein
MRRPPGGRQGLVMADESTAALRPQAIFEFADLTLDAGQCAVFRGAERIPLPKLSYELLFALVDAAPDLLSHDTLAERVWQRRLVTPETLAQRMLLLRRALGDDAGAPRYLRVIRGLGFQLMPPVKVRRNPATPRSSPLAATDGTGGIITELTADIDLSLPAQPSIVILPFDTDRDPRHQDFARGLSHDVMTRIARARSLFVIARGTAFSFAPGAHDVREVSRRLGVRYVAQGNIQFDGSKMRINAGLADAIEDRELWANHFHCEREGLFDAQEEIADLIVGAIAAEVELAERQRAVLERPANLDAWVAYHRGCWHMYRFTPGDYEQAQSFFEHSARLDPNSPRTFAGLSFVHWQRAFMEITPDRPGEIQRAFDRAVHGISLNPRDPLGHWALGRAHLLRGEIGEAIAELTTATDLNPSFAIGQYSLGFALLHAGETTRSLEMAKKARRLSPYDPMGFAMIGLRGFSLALRGEYSQAAELLADSIKQPNAHFHMVAMAVVCDALAGHEDAARRDLTRLRKARPGYDAKDFLRAYPLQQAEHTKLIDVAFRRLEHLT